MLKGNRDRENAILSARMFNWPPEPYCLGCVHYRRLYDNEYGHRRGMVCHYLLDTGTVRGCPFGKGCTRWTDDKSRIINRDWMDA